MKEDSNNNTQSVENSIKKILSNKKLTELITKIANYSYLINSEYKYMFLVSLISSDNIVDTPSANESLNALKFIEKYIDVFDISEEDMKEVMKYVKKGIRICKKDLKIFKEQGI